MRFVILYILLLISYIGFGQQNLLPIHSFYKDHLFANKNGIQISNGSFFPISEGEIDLISAINDSSKQYYTATEILFKKHLFEIEGKDFQINISPLFNFSRSIDFNDTTGMELFQNTRGIIVEVDLFKNFSFATMFFENQGRYTQYEESLYRSLGEMYPKVDSTYQTQNAVLPGAGRTKNFKEGGFDYAYAIGYMSYLPHKNVRISAGNNQQFIGDGHRSLLLSDNSYSAPYLRVDWNISPKLRYSYHRARTLNLMRRTIKSSTEAFYELKNYSVNYLTYMPTNWLNVSLFEGTQWNRGDSLNTTRLHPAYYNPLPLINTFTLDGRGELASLLGLNIGASVHKNHRVYSQIAVNDLQFDNMAFQIGYRGYRFFGLNDLMLQAELNVVPSGFYENNNPRLNYTHYNMALAHSKGQGFSEVILRASYEFMRFYIDQSVAIYSLQDYAQRDLLSVYEEPDRYSGLVSNSITELGYRFNRKVNFTAFVAFQYRADHTGAERDAAVFSFGFKTGLINHYKDF